MSRLHKPTVVLCEMLVTLLSDYMKKLSLGERLFIVKKVETAMSSIPLGISAYKKSDGTTCSSYAQSVFEADQAERRVEFLVNLRFVRSAPDDRRFPDQCGFWIDRLGGMAGAW